MADSMTLTGAATATAMGDTRPSRERNSTHRTLERFARLGSSVDRPDLVGGPAGRHVEMTDGPERPSEEC